MNNQQAFSFIKKKLLKQKEQSLSVSGATCKYKGVNDNRCAVGHLIPNSLYSPKFECLSIDKVLNGKLLDFDADDKQKKLKEHLKCISIDLLLALQYLHDFYDPEEWKEQFANIAKQFGLRNE